MNTRWQEIRTLHRDHRFFYRILGGAILVGLGVLIGASIFAEKQLDYLMSLFTNVLSIFVTVFVLDELARRRDERINEQEAKARLIREMRSIDNAISQLAVDELRAKGWHKDGTLRGKSLSGANLEGLRLHEFDFEGTNFSGANLQNTILYRANLSGCEFSGAKMQGVKMIESNLSNASLTAANLKGAILFQADCKSASFLNAYMKKASLLEANIQDAEYMETIEYDMETRMPDNQLYFPNKTSVYTDPNSPNFWRSSNSRSPAYRGKRTN